MKKLLAVTLAALLALSVMGCNKDEEDGGAEIENNVAAGDVLEHGDFEYSVNEQGDYEISGYNYYGAEKKKVEIPAEIDGRPVTGIGAGAFKKAANNINGVVIPSSVTYIDEFAFYGCTALTEVVIPDSVTEIGMGAFKDCSSLEKVTLSATLTTIGDACFMGCKKLSAVTVPATVKTIGMGAFWNCTALESITIPESVTEIGDAAFYCCTGLKTAEFLANELTLGEIVFNGCNQEVLVIRGAKDTAIQKYATDWGFKFEIR
ncbi:MAG: leucine-rich repeat domain-containing protein [Clostridia bacterium]|nr:leucine-rich repeat domain-containing protein [Clostridia bacterium]